MEKWEAEKLQILVKLESYQNHRNWYEDRIKILKLANKAYLLYLQQNSFEKRNLLNYVISNFFIDNESRYYTYKKPFGYISEGLESANWLPRPDSNQRQDGYDLTHISVRVGLYHCHITSKIEET